MKSIALLISLVCNLPDIYVTLPPFNAIPDGSADCTAALQAAADAARIRQITDETDYVLAQTVPTIHLDSGIYTLSGPITFQSMACIKGNNAVIVQTQDTDSFSFPNGTHVDITGCTFVNGTRAVFIANENINTCMFNIKQCTFSNIKETALVLKSTATATLSIGVLSATLNIDKCSFRNCYRALDECCDFANITGCQVLHTSSTRTAPLSENGYHCVFAVRRGRCHIKDSIMRSIPQRATVPASQCWVYTTGSLILSDTQFSDNGDARQTVVFGPTGVDPANNNGESIRLFGCNLADTLTSANMSAASIALYGMPSHIQVTNCSLKVVSPLISDPQGMGANAAAAMKIAPKLQFSANTDFPNTIRIPTSLSKYVIK